MHAININSDAKIIFLNKKCIKIQQIPFKFNTIIYKIIILLKVIDNQLVMCLCLKKKPINFVAFIH